MDTPTNDDVRDVMVDLETMGTTAGAAIISIGAVAFDEERIVSSFYMNVSLKDCVAEGLAIDPDTVMWWMQQSDEARRALYSSNLSLFTVLSEFSKWLPWPNDEIRIWGNGANFDNVILRAAYTAMRLEAPWKHWNDRCYRTVKAQYKEAVPFVRQGVAHNALDDAVSQAQHLQAICKQTSCQLR